MKTFKEDIVKIYRTERGIMLIMGLNFILAALFIAYIVSHLSPSIAMVKVGYGDIGGYRDGSWFDLSAFIGLAIIFGIFHSLLAVRIFHKRGSGMTKFFLIITTMLIAGAFLVASRLIEGYNA